VVVGVGSESGTQLQARGGDVVAEAVGRLIRTYYDVQKLRIAVQNRLQRKFTRCNKGHLIPTKAGEPGQKARCPICGGEAVIVEEEPPKVLAELANQLIEQEKLLYKAIYDFVKQHILWKEYLSMVRGVGPVLAAWLITQLNPARFEKVSGMWKYCGLHVVNGRAPRRIAGQKTDFNPFARTMAWKLGESFRKRGGVYRWFYERFYEECRAKHPDWTPAHCLNHARRVTVKLFLSHWYEAGRRILGLPWRKPYIAEKFPEKYIPPLVDEEPGKKALFYETVLSRLDPADLEKYRQIVEAVKKWIEKRKAEAGEAEQPN
jgi:hypothetical protein